MNIQFIALSELKPYEKNPRNNEKAIDKVAESIKQFGFKVPIVIDKDNVIVAGHTRYKAAQQLGLNEVPCIVADDLTDKQIKAYRLADNKVAEFSEWDFDLLSEELNALDDFDMCEFGFEIEDVEFEVQEVIEAEIPEQVETRCKRGDVWKLGKHRLMCGDSTSITDVETLMNGEKADMLLTDPPYNVDYEGGTGLKIQNDSMEDGNFRQFLIDAFVAGNAVMKNGAAFYVWHADSEGFNFRWACKEAGWKVRQCLIWNKSSLVMGRQDYQWKHEPCLYGWKEGASHLWTSDRKQTTVIDFDKPQRNGEHPTMKPVGLFDYQIKNNTKRDHIVLDLFGGSGTTIIACEQNGRVGYSMEFDEHYCDVIIQRWEDLTGEKAIKL